MAQEQEMTQCDGGFNCPGCSDCERSEARCKDCGYYESECVCEMQAAEDEEGVS